MNPGDLALANNESNITINMVVLKKWKLYSDDIILFIFIHEGKKFD